MVTLEKRWCFQESALNPIFLLHLAPDSPEDNDSSVVIDNTGGPEIGFILLKFQLFLVLSYSLYLWKDQSSSLVALRILFNS